MNSLLLDVDSINRQLQKRAIESPNLAVPFRVTGGSFENLQVEVPWAKISSKPVLFTARGLAIHVTPFDPLSVEKFDKLSISNERDFHSPHRASSTGDENTVGSKKKEKKVNRRLQSIFDANESRNRANALQMLAATDDLDEKNLSSSSAASGFGARQVRRIIGSLHLEISDVKIVLNGCGCNAGVQLKSLSLVTTDSNGKLAFVDRTGRSTSRKF